MRRPAVRLAGATANTVISASFHMHLAASQQNHSSAISAVFRNHHNGFPEGAMNEGVAPGLGIHYALAALRTVQTAVPAFLPDRAALPGHLPGVAWLAVAGVRGAVLSCLAGG